MNHTKLMADLIRLSGVNKDACQSIMLKLVKGCDPKGNPKRSLRICDHIEHYAKELDVSVPSRVVELIEDIRIQCSIQSM